MAKSLIIYFSRASENYGSDENEKGNTEYVADFIQELTGADVFRVEPATPYSTEYQACTEEAKERQANHDAPIVGAVPDLADFDTIFIGAPVYWGVLPEEMVTALSPLDFSGKTVRPFVTHEGSEFGNILDQLDRLCEGATIADGLAIRGSRASLSKSKVDRWLSH